MTTIKTTKQMLAYGETLARELSGGEIICLAGELGAGKTALAKGIARGLGVTGHIASPTFTLMNIRDTGPEAAARGINRLAHIDTYRLKNATELTEIGVEDYLGAPDTVCVVEWPKKITELLRNKKTIIIKIEHSDKNNRRVFKNHRL